MKLNRTLATVIFIAALLLASESFAQQRTGLNRNVGNGPGNVYDPKTVETIKGDVVNIGEFTLATGMPPGVKLILKTAGEVLPIYLGPQWYIDNENFEIEPGDRIDVKGSKIMYEGKPAIVAAVIFSGERVLKLRDENGIPVWSSWVPRQ